MKLLLVILCALLFVLHAEGSYQGRCSDKAPLSECIRYQSNDECWTSRARMRCGVTCRSCGRACSDAHLGCQDEMIKEELCAHHAGAFMICPRSCGLCIDR